MAASIDVHSQTPPHTNSNSPAIPLMTNPTAAAAAPHERCRRCASRCRTKAPAAVIGARRAGGWAYRSAALLEGRRQRPLRTAPSPSLPATLCCVHSPPPPRRRPAAGRRRRARAVAPVESGAARLADGGGGGGAGHRARFLSSFRLVQCGGNAGRELRRTPARELAACSARGPALCSRRSTGTPPRPAPRRLLRLRPWGPGEPRPGPAEAFK